MNFASSTLNPLSQCFHNQQNPLGRYLVKAILLVVLVLVPGRRLES